MQDFVTALTPGNPGFGLTLATVLITFSLGFMVYVYSVVLVNHEDAGPYPVWMHAFYCAADFMGIWAFMSAYDAVGGFWFFRGSRDRRARACGCSFSVLNKQIPWRSRIYVVGYSGSSAAVARRTNRPSSSIASALGFDKEMNEALNAGPVSAVNKLCADEFS